MSVPIFNDESWGKIGKIPAESDFFAVDVDIDDVIDGTGFTSAYSKLIGEQVFKITQPSETPFTVNHTGSPISAGAGWVERLTKRLTTGSTTSGSAKAGMMARLDTRIVTADDDLRFYDSEGKEFVYKSENVAGWCPVSLPSGLDLYDMFTTPNGFANMNGMLVDNVKQAYDRALESEIQKHAVNLAPVYEQTTLRGKELFTYIRDEIAKFKSDDYAFNYMSDQDNADYEHRSTDVLVYMNAIQYNDMMDDFANLPSPEFVNQSIGATFVLMNNKIVTPYATDTAMSKDGFTDYGGITTSDMPMIGKDAPEIMIMDKRWIEYRPVIDGYRVNISKNGAGDFTNEHLIFKGGLNIKPWANCKAIGLTE